MPPTSTHSMYRRKIYRHRNRNLKKRITPFIYTCPQCQPKSLRTPSSANSPDSQETIILLNIQHQNEIQNIKDANVKLHNELAEKVSAFVVLQKKLDLIESRDRVDQGTSKKIPRFENNSINEDLLNTIEALIEKQSAAFAKLVQNIETKHIEMSDDFVNKNAATI